MEQSSILLNYMPVRRARVELIGVGVVFAIVLFAACLFRSPSLGKFLCALLVTCGTYLSCFTFKYFSKLTSFPGVHPGLYVFSKSRIEQVAFIFIALGTIVGILLPE